MKHNLSQLGVPSEAYTKAVGAVNGAGRLDIPDYGGSDHGRYLVLGDGPLEVLCIDSLGVRGGDIAIKADVEGGELEVLKGASETISSARKCVIAFEAHPKVTIRTGRDPVECLRFHSTVRHFNFVIAETGQLLSPSSSLITDADTRVFNVIAWTP
jgi:Methyltransferase FkbM domain